MLNQRAVCESSVSVGGNAEITSNQNLEMGVVITIKNINEVTPDKMIAKEQSFRYEPSSSKRVTITSLYAIPKERNINKNPDRTGQIARESNARGILLKAELING